MSEPEIIEAVDTRNVLNSEKDAQMLTDRDQKEIDICRAMQEMLAEVEEVVDEIHVVVDKIRNANVGFSSWNILDELPYSLSRRMRKLLPQEGLEGLTQEVRQKARLRILGALSLCLEGSAQVTLTGKELIWVSELSPSEVEALYRRLESSTALKYVCIDIPANASENWGPESWRLFADILLGAQSLIKVTLEDQPLSELENLAKAVAASSRGPSPVQSLVIKHGLQYPLRSGGTKGSVTAEWVEIIAKLNAAAPNLKELCIEIGPFVDEDVAELIGEAVVWLQSLEALIIEDVGGDCDSSRAKKKMDFRDRLLSRAFLGNPCNTSINALQLCLGGNGASSLADRYPQVLYPVLQMNIHITRLILSWDEKLLARDLHNFLRNLSINGINLKSLELRQWLCGGLPEVGGPESLVMGFDPDSFSILVEILKSNSMPGLKHLTLAMNSLDPDYITNDLDWPGLYSSLAQMESVCVRGCVGLGQAEREIMEWIQTSQALQKLVLLPQEVSEVTWRSIFHCFKENSNIRHLTVRGKALEDDGAYRELMEVLQVNSTLQEVEFRGGGHDSSRAAAVREALKGTARQESYLAELQKGLGGGRGKWQSPKCGRVFLCGAPEAGKTRLTRTMLKVAKGQSWVKRFQKKLRRTEGVEVHT